MTAVTKIIFLGASSGSFGISMFRDLFSSHDLAGSTLVLVGRSVDRLARAERLAKLLNEKSGAGLKIERTTDWRAAFDGAEFVIHSTAIDRNRLWKLDWEVPRKFGIRHTLGENGGPGGLFFTMRTLPVVFDFVREMERRCPQALFINFSNPESRIVLALGQYSKIRTIGLCHGIFLARNQVASILGLPAEQVEVWGAGLNHFQCLMQIRDRETGADLYPRCAKRKKATTRRFLLLRGICSGPSVIGSAAAMAMSVNTCHLAGRPARADTISNGTKASGRNWTGLSTTCFQERQRSRRGG